MTVWLITGATRGFGRAIAREALSRGDDVVATGRDVSHLDPLRSETEARSGRLVTVALDVTDPASISAAVRAAIDELGSIDVLVNNAGNGLIGAVEEVSDAEVRSVFETNVFGLLALTREVLPVMRRQRSGRVVMMSSMGGFTQPGVGWGVYGATKFALEGLSEALRHEVADLGIEVMIVEPGSFRTDFLAGSSVRIADAVIDDYADTVGRTRAMPDTYAGAQPGDPDRAARVIVATVAAGSLPARLPLGADAVRVIEAKLDAVRENIDAVREVATSTDVD